MSYDPEKCKKQRNDSLTTENKQLMAKRRLFKKMQQLLWNKFGLVEFWDKVRLTFGTKLGSNLGQSWVEIWNKNGFKYGINKD